MDRADGAERMDACERPNPQEKDAIAPLWRLAYGGLAVAQASAIERHIFVPRRRRSERFRHEVDERAHLRREVATLGIDGIDTELQRAELAEDRFQRA